MVENREIGKFEVALAYWHLSVCTFEVIGLAEQTTIKAQWSTTFEKGSHHRTERINRMKFNLVVWRGAVVYTANRKIVNHSGLWSLNQGKAPGNYGSFLQVCHRERSYGPAFFKFLFSLYHELLVHRGVPRGSCHGKDHLVSLGTLLQLSNSSHARLVEGLKSWRLFYFTSQSCPLMQQLQCTHVLIPKLWKNFRGE